jgi:DNA-binding MarR family transcriptional regulator
MPVSADAESRVSQRERLQQQFTEVTELLSARMRMVREPVEWPELELTMPQFRVLGLLFSAPHRMSEIAATAGSSVQAATSLIDRLVDKGLVAREHDTVDRRVVICHLTPVGRAEVEQFYRIGQARTELLTDVLADDELELVVDAFTVLAEAALRLRAAERASDQGSLSNAADAVLAS